MNCRLFRSQNCWNLDRVSLYFERDARAALPPSLSAIKAAIASSTVATLSSSTGLPNCAFSYFSSSSRLARSAAAQERVFSDLRYCFPCQLQRRCLRQLQRFQRSSPWRSQSGVVPDKDLDQGDGRHGLRSGFPGGTPKNGSTELAQFSLGLIVCD